MPRSHPPSQEEVELAPPAGLAERLRGAVVDLPVYCRLLPAVSS